MKVLVIQQRYGIGDMLIFLPYLKAISEKNNVKISLLAKKSSRSSARFVGENLLDEIINLGNQPPANSLAKTSGEFIDVVPLKLLFCYKCGTVQLSQHIAPQELFSDYVWVTGTSGVANDYSKNFSELVLNKCGLQKPRIIEIASNDGTF